MLWAWDIWIWYVFFAFLNIGWFIFLSVCAHTCCRSTGVIDFDLCSCCRMLERCELLESGSINDEKGEFSNFVLPLTIGGFMLWLKGRLIVLVLFAPALVFF